MRSIAFSLLVSVACLGADANLLSLVMPDARFYSGIDVARSRGTPFGQYVLTQMEPAEPELKKLLEAAGFDARRDLSAIVACAGGTAEAPVMLLIGSGTFDVARFEAAARAGGAAPSERQGVRMLARKTAAGRLFAFAFPNASTVLAGDAAAVEAAIARHAAGTPADARLAQRAAELGRSYDAWFLSTGPVAEFLTGNVDDPSLKQAMQSGLLGAVLSASGGLRFGADAVTLAGEAVTRSEKDARALGDVVRFVASLVQWDEPGGIKASLGKSMEVAANEAGVLTISASMPERVVERLFMQKGEKPAAAPPAR